MGVLWSHCFIFLVLMVPLSLSSRHSRDFRKDQWESTDFIWNIGIVSLCDKGPEEKPSGFFDNEDSPFFNEEAYKNIQSGDIVWVKCRFIGQFYERVLPETKGPFVLVISGGDESFPSQCGLSLEQLEKFLLHKNIVHVFAQNCDFEGTHPKISHLPIGLDFHTIAYKGIRGGWGEIGSPQQQEFKLKQIIELSAPTHLRKKRAFVDFQFSDSMHGEHKRYLQFGEDRTSIFNRLRSTGLIDYGPWMRRSELWKTKVQYAFSISPHGNGLDCHRTWEDLVLGCIVVVKTSSLDPLYEGLPVVIVQDWSEVTAENMDRWFELYKDASTWPTYREKLTHRYWIEKIRAAALPYKAVL